MKDCAELRCGVSHIIWALMKIIFSHFEVPCHSAHQPKNVETKASDFVPWIRLRKLPRNS